MPKLGLCFVNPAPEIEPGYVKAMARKCEEMGFDSFWVIDRIAYDNLEPLTVLATVAGVTEKVRIGTSVLLAALRHPSLLAKAVATLDLLSNGRVTLGIGFGSRESDFTAVGVPFNGRGSRAEEALKLMKRLWTEDNVTHKGKYYAIESLTIGPKPVQYPHPPLWMGGSADAALRRAARLANGYVCGSTAILEFPSVWEKISAFARAAGRNPNEIEKAALTFMAVDEDKSKAVEACAAYLRRYYGGVRVDVEKHFVVGPPEACAERIKVCFEKGLETLIVGMAKADLRQLDLFAQRALPYLKPLLTAPGH